MKWVRRADWETPIPKQVETGLTDQNWEVRIAWARRQDYVPTLEQIERGLTDCRPEVRAAWARRTDYVLTPEQIERGLTDTDEHVCSAWQKRLKMMAQGIQNELLELDQLGAKG